MVKKIIKSVFSVFWGAKISHENAVKFLQMHSGLNDHKTEDLKELQEEDNDFYTHAGKLLRTNGQCYLIIKEQKADTENDFVEVHKVGSAPSDAEIEEYRPFIRERQVRLYTLLANSGTIQSKIEIDP